MTFERSPFVQQNNITKTHLCVAYLRYLGENLLALFVLCVGQRLAELEQEFGPRAAEGRVLTFAAESCVLLH